MERRLIAGVDRLVFDPPLYIDANGSQVRPDSELEKYKAKELREYSDLKFKASEDLLPKAMVPAAVKCPAEHIAGRVAAYLK